MSDLIIAVTVAVLITVLSKYLLKVVIEPLIEFKKVLSEIGYLTLYYQSNIVSSPTNNKEVGEKFRHLSASLLKSYDSIFYYEFARLISLYRLPKYKGVKTACRKLNLLHSTISYLEKDFTEIEESLNEISEHLNIHTRYS